MALRFEPRGVIPATLLAFDAELQIDEPESRRHLRHVAAVGLSSATRVGEKIASATQGVAGRLRLHRVGQY